MVLSCCVPYIYSVFQQVTFCVPTRYYKVTMVVWNKLSIQGRYGSYRVGQKSVS